MASAVKSAVVILNYNNWQDTIACVESVLSSSVPPYFVFVVDNASPDDSFARLQAWAQGHLEDELLGLGVKHSLQKPIKYSVFTNAEHSPTQPDTQLVFIKNAQNNGYSAGNNLGIKLAMRFGADAVWILNNDTIIEKDALQAMQKCLFSKARPGLCGSLVCYVDTGLVQCCGGGKTNPLNGLSCLYGHNVTREEARKFSTNSVEKEINFIYGASVMASRNFIETVGLMDERYFLYCEEQDWAYSAKGRFDLAYAPLAVVHHKEGSTTGFSSKKMSVRSLWHLTRSRILLTYKHKPWALPTVFLSIGFAATRMFWRRIFGRRSLPIKSEK